MVTLLDRSTSRSVYTAPVRLAGQDNDVPAFRKQQYRRGQRRPFGPMVGPEGRFFCVLAPPVRDHSNRA